MARGCGRLRMSASDAATAIADGAGAGGGRAGGCAMPSVRRRTPCAEIDTGAPPVGIRQVFSVPSMEATTLPTPTLADISGGFRVPRACQGRDDGGMG